MAGTPYWRERKLVTSSSVRKPSFTKAEPRRQLRLLLDLGRLFQLLWGDDLLFDEKITQPLRHTSISYLSDREIRLTIVACAKCAAFRGEKLQRIALTQIVNADGLRHQ